MRNRYDIEAMPFVRILPLVVAGIVVGDMCDLAWYVPLSGAAVCLSCAVIWREKAVGSLYAAVTVMLFAMLMTSLRRVESRLPYDIKCVCSFGIVSNPSPSGRWSWCEATVDSYRAAESDEWHASGERVMLSVDSSLHFSAGERFVTQTYFNPFDDNAYGRLMRRRGFGATAFVADYRPVVVLPPANFSIGLLGARLQRWAVGRFDRLGMNDSAGDVCRAMAFGYRSGIDSDLRTDYSKSGASHLLAVSGLHVGIVTMLLNFLLYLLPLARGGNILRSVLVVVGVWIYALLAGFSPSVVRAAFMFSGVQAALTFSRLHSGLNIICCTAAVMLLVNPNYLFDISFQLSFIAVFGIVFLFSPFMHMVESRWKPLNALWGVIIVGIASSVAVAPLSVYTFGRLPLAGVFINPVVIFTANIIVLFSMLQVFMPFVGLAPVFRAVLEWSGGLQNRVVEFTASKWWASVEVGDIPLWSVVGFYIVAGVAVVYIVSRPQKERKIRLYDRQ